MKDLFDEVKNLRQEGSWCSPEKTTALMALVLAFRPKVIVELGVWTGSSLIPLALAAKALGTWDDPFTKRKASSVVHAVDPWDADASAEGQIPINADWWHSAPHEWAFDTFQKRLLEFEVEHVVEVHRMKSGEFQPPAGIGLWHCDGNHGPTVVDDVERYAPNIKIGGIAILDDFFWEGDHVQRAGARLEDMGFRPLYDIDTVSFGRVFQRVAMR